MVVLRRKPLPGTAPALFIHIQKTAGTALVNHARRYYGQSITSHGECWGVDPAQLSDIGFISGHIGYHFARRLMPGRYTFTFLRDPAERVLSLYYFCRTRDPGEFEIYKRARELNLTEFLHAGLSDPWVKKNIWNNQVWQLAHGYAHLDNRTLEDFSDAELLQAAQAHLEELSFVGLTETFTADSARILRALGLPKVKEMPRLNVGPTRLRATEQPCEIRKLLEKLTELDRQLYTYAKTVRSKQRRMWWWER